MGKDCAIFLLDLEKAVLKCKPPANPSIQSGLGLLWQKSRPDSPDLLGQLTCCGSQSTESNSVHACGRLAHFCWETKRCSSLFSSYRCASVSNHRNHRWGKYKIVTFPCLRKKEARTCLCIFCIIQVSLPPKRNKSSWVHW